MGWHFTTPSPPSPSLLPPQAGILQGEISNLMVMDQWQASLMRALAKLQLRSDPRVRQKLEQQYDLEEGGEELGGEEEGAGGGGEAAGEGAGGAAAGGGEGQGQGKGGKQLSKRQKRKMKERGAGAGAVGKEEAEAAGEQQ